MNSLSVSEVSIHYFIHWTRITLIKLHRADDKQQHTTELRHSLCRSGCIRYCWSKSVWSTCVTLWLMPHCSLSGLDTVPVTVIIDQHVTSCATFVLSWLLQMIQAIQVLRFHLLELEKVNKTSKHVIETLSLPYSAIILVFTAILLRECRQSVRPSVRL